MTELTIPGLLWQDTNLVKNTGSRHSSRAPVRVGDLAQWKGPCLECARPWVLLHHQQIKGTYCMSQGTHRSRLCTRGCRHTPTCWRCIVHLYTGTPSCYMTLLLQEQKERKVGQQQNAKMAASANQRRQQRWQMYPA